MNDADNNDGMGAAGCLVIAVGVSVLLWLMIGAAGMAMLGG